MVIIPLLLVLGQGQRPSPLAQPWVSALRKQIPEVKRKALAKPSEKPMGAGKPTGNAAKSRSRIPKSQGHLVSGDPNNGGPLPSSDALYPKSAYWQKFAEVIPLMQRAKYAEIIQNTRDAYWFTVKDQDAERYFAAMALAIAYFRMGDPVEALRCTRDYLAPDGYRPGEIDQIAGCIAYYQGMNLPGLKEYLLEQVDPENRIGLTGNSPPERKVLAIMALNGGCQWVRGYGWDSFCDMGASIQPNNPLFVDSWVRQAMGGDTIEKISADTKRGILRLAPLERVEKVYQRFLPLVAQYPRRKGWFEDQLVYYDYLKWAFRRTAIKNGWKP